MVQLVRGPSKPSLPFCLRSFRSFLRFLSFVSRHFLFNFFFLVSFLWFAGRWLQECRKDRFEWTRFRKIRARESSRGRPFSLPRRWHPRSRSYFASFASVPSHRIPVRGQHSSQLAVRAMVFANFATIASLNDPINDLVIHPVIKTLLHI